VIKNFLHQLAVIHLDVTEYARPPYFMSILGTPQDTVSELLSSIQPQLDKFIKGEINFPPWNPDDISASPPNDVQDFINGLELRSIQGGYPQMQIQDLGSFQNDPVLNKRVDHIFCPGQNT
jgi:hypothetical protein